MNEERFWAVVSLFDWSRSGDDDGVLEPAVARLASMSVDEIRGFDEVLAQRLHALDTEAHARNVGEDAHFSVDQFLYARCAVVANGVTYFRKVLARPEEMPEDLEFEAILYLAAKAFERQTGTPFEHVAVVSDETFSNKAGWRR